jgi:hypothetical protein
MHPRTSEANPRPARRTQTVVVNGYKVSISADLAGISPDQMTIMHVRTGLHEHWPDGLLGHVTNLTEDGAHSLVIWISEAKASEYFQHTALDMITSTVPALRSEPSGEHLGDFIFELREIHSLVLTDECRAFTDIGADLDHSSIEALGGEPIVVRLRFPETSTERYDAAVESLGYRTKLPDGMILQLVETSSGTITESQCWRSEELARQELDQRYLPAVASLSGDELAPQIDPVSRFFFGGAALDRALNDDG